RDRQARGRARAVGVASDVLDHLVAILAEQRGLRRDEAVFAAELAIPVVNLEDAQSSARPGLVEQLAVRYRGEGVIVANAHEDTPQLVPTVVLVDLPAVQEQVCDPAVVLHVRGGTREMVSPVDGAAEDARVVDEPGP